MGQIYYSSWTRPSHSSLRTLQRYHGAAHMDQGESWGVHHYASWWNYVVFHLDHEEQQNVQQCFIKTRLRQSGRGVRNYQCTKYFSGRSPCYYCLWKPTSCCNKWTFQGYHRAVQLGHREIWGVHWYAGWWNNLLFHWYHEEEQASKQCFVEEIAPSFIYGSSWRSYLILQNVWRLLPGTVSRRLSHRNQKGHGVSKIHPWIPRKYVQMVHPCDPCLQVIPTTGRSYCGT